MGIFYKDKPAFDSKKFKLALVALISIAATPIATSYLGIAAPAVVDQAAPVAADYIIEVAMAAGAAVAYAYLKAQGQVDSALASAREMKESVGVVSK